MGADTVTAAKLLKDVYLGPPNNQLPNLNLLMKRMEKVKKKTSGNKWVFNIRKGRNWGVGAIAEGGDLPTGQNQKYDQPYSVPVENTGVIYLSNRLIEVSQSDPAAFAPAVKSEMQGMNEDFFNNYERQLFGDGSGKLAIVRVVDAVGPPGKIHVNDMFDKNTKQHYLEPGMIVQFRSSAGALRPNPAGKNGYEVSKCWDPDVDAIEFTEALDAAIVATDRIYLASGPTGSSYNNEIDGIAAHVSDANPTKGNLMGVDVATVNVWKSFVDSAAADRALTEKLMRRVLRATEKRSGQTIDVIVTSPEGEQAYGDLQAALKRFPNTVKLEGGYDAEALTFDKRPVVPMRHCQSRRFYFLCSEKFQHLQTSDIGWMDRDGSVLHFDGSKAAYKAVQVLYSNLAQLQRNAHGLLDAIIMDAATPMG